MPLTEETTNSNSELPAPELMKEKEEDSNREEDIENTPQTTTIEAESTEAAAPSKTIQSRVEDDDYDDEEYPHLDEDDDEPAHASIYKPKCVQSLSNTC
jgi:hypothetical protein